MKLAPPPALGRWAQVETGAFRFGRQAQPKAAPVDTAPPDFGAWMAQARPEHEWTAPHFLMMADALDRATRGELRRILFGIPIRHGKTEFATVGYAAYRLERDPKTRILVGSYNQRQADKLSREIRKLAKARGVAVSEDRDAASEWETAAGGGVRAVGAGGGVASVNADVIIIDDPIGSRAEAESTAHRDRVWDWITNDLLARTEPHTVVTFSMSRWHEDDPVGRLLKMFADKWHHIDLPAEAGKDDALGREVGEPLWPELRGPEWLAEKRLELGIYGFASLLQQRPAPREGKMFKWDWFKLVDAAPRLATRVRYWDTAGTDATGKNDPDFTSGTLMARTPAGRYLIEHVARGQWGLSQRDAQIKAVADQDARTYGVGAVTQWFEREAGVGGQERTAAIVRLLAGHTVHSEPATGSKILRAEPFASQAQAGNVDMLKDPTWNTAVLSVYADFPTGNHDDDVDSAAGAFNKLAAGAGQAWTTTSLASVLRR